MATLGMARGVESINGEQCVSEENGLSCHAVGLECAREVIDDYFWRNLPMRVYRRKHVVPPFRRRNAMKSVAYTMRAPHAHYSTCQPRLAIPRKKFVAPFTSFFFAAGVIHILVLEIWVLWSVANLGHPVARTSLSSQ